MNIDLSSFKVTSGNRLLKAITLMEIIFPDTVDFNDIHQKPNLIAVLVINEDGNLEVIRDEAWRFQFIPNLDKCK